MTSGIKVGRGEDISERIVIGVDNKLISIPPIGSQVFMELFCNSPLQTQELLFVRFDTTVWFHS